MVTAQNVLIAILMLVGTAGIVLPVLPGLLLVWGAAVLWVFETQSQVAWIVLAVVTVAYAAGLAGQYVFPGRRMRTAGVGTMTIVLALVAGVVGFFVIPVIGGPLAFVGAVYAVERVKYREHPQAWAATKHAVRAVVLSMGIELAAALVIMATWATAVVVSANA